MSLLLGCGIGFQNPSPNGVTTPTNSSSKLLGQVYGGQQPITGASIQLYAVASVGQTASVPLLTQAVTTDDQGSFNITGLYSCPSASTNVYIAATGGNPGLAPGQTNASIVLMAALGHCGDLSSSTYVSINEITTVAAIYGLAPFMQSYASVGAGATDDAFAVAAQLANTATGATPGAAVAGQTVPSDKIRALADILAACVNSSGAGTAACDLLFILSAPPYGSLPADTAAATLQIALNPTNNAAYIFSLNPTTGPFQPTLATAPADWTMTLTPAPNLAITSATLPVSVQGDPYVATLQAQGGTPGYRWAVKTGALPSGIALDATSGTISGRPMLTGHSEFTVAVSDQGQPAQAVTATMALDTVAPLSVSGSLPSGTAGASYGSSLTAAGGVPAYTWSVQSGTLPPGVFLAATTGMLSGTPTTAGAYSFTLAVSDNSSPAQVVTAPVSMSILPSGPQTWYVRPDGGTRYSVNVTNGQCDGLGDAPYPGTGINQHCAFKDARLLWSDGSYNYGTQFPGWGWIGNGGDTYILRGSLSTGTSYRVGWNSNSTYCDSTGCWGITGDRANSGAPVPPSGTATQHTRILGENYASCHTAGAKTQLHGGWGVFTVLSLAGASNVDVSCLDITDFSACGRATQQQGCDSSQDFAQNGIRFSNTTTDVSLSDIHIHGMATNGIWGPTGDNVTLDYVDILGNASSGWNADLSDGSTGIGHLNISHYNISWNGCAEEYPNVHALPYGDCTDDINGGYGDGFGTATVDSPAPGWQVHFDQGTVSYNTQDGLDALHISGPGSSMTVTRTLAHSNMGQQLKVGGAAPTMINNVIVGNCTAMGYAIPGTPPGFNTHIGDFCRAADTAVMIKLPPTVPGVYQNNTIYSANHVALEIEYAGAKAGTETIQFNNNVFIGFVNTDNNYPSPIYSSTDLAMFSNPGASYTNNVTFRPKGNFDCSANGGSKAICGDPQLVDESLHPFGYGDMSPSAGSVVLGRGTAIPGVTVDYTGATRNNPPAIGAYE